MNKSSKITTAVAFLILAVCLSVGAYLKAHHPDFPYELYGSFMLIAVGGYTGKRLADKTARFGGNGAVVTKTGDPLQ